MAHIRLFALGLCSVGFVLVPVWAQSNSSATPQSGVVPAGQGKRAGQLPARIMDFKVEPASIQPGQKVTLSWSLKIPPA